MSVYRSPDTITLDVHAQSIKTPVFFVTGDVNAYPLLFKIVDGGVNKYDLTDKVVAIVCKVPNNVTPIVDSLTITDPAEGLCAYTVKNTIYANAGEIQAEIHIFDSEQNRLSTCTFYMTVRQGIDDSCGIEASDNYPILVHLIAQVQGNRTGKLQYTIACSDSVNKDRADLVLTGEVDANGGSLDVPAINAALAALDTARVDDKTISVRVDFLGGHIDNINDTIVIPENFVVYGNGVILSAKLAVEGFDGSVEWINDDEFTYTQPALSPFIGMVLTSVKADIYGVIINLSMDEFNYRSSSGIELAEGCIFNSIFNSELIYDTFYIRTSYGVISNCTFKHLSFGTGIITMASKIIGCSFEGTSNLGISISAMHSQISECTFGDTNDSTAINGQVLNINACKFKKSTSGGYNIAADDSVIANCTFEGCDGGANIYGANTNVYCCTIGIIRSAFAIDIFAGNIMGCTFESIGNYAQGISISSGYNNMVINNTIRNIIGLGGVGISIFEGANCFASNNNIGTVSGAEAVAIQLSGSGTVKKANIENNVFVA